ncbi:MLO-like protein 1 [Camellia lanceoleosa]|uniref:MLO-like protein 1 n=1 Tax=Camellia lanceoleosa TaxID=1840588 RepID=A0ACC0FPR3_9ERIC|nr:MLO-like protein 1 [Camellia lanceoleosa]
MGHVCFIIPRLVIGVFVQVLCSYSTLPLYAIVTQTAVHRSFAVADNLGEVSANAQIQTVCFNSLGLMLAP